MRAHRLVCALTFGLVAISASGAGALEVAAGCDELRASAHGRTFFIDPSHGDKSNDGSEQKPWRTLAEALDPANKLVSTRSYGRVGDHLGPPAPINPEGPIKPGDTIVLMSGDHGAVNASRYVNSAFISVVAGPGQTPLVRSLRLLASSHWLFRGVKFQGIRPENDKSSPLVGVQSHDWAGPSDNVVFVDNSFSTEDDVQGWTPEDWVMRPYATGFASTARCTTLVNNHFYNLRDAVGIGGDKSLVHGNVIEDMGNDGIDMTASDIVIRGNVIRSGRHTPAEPLHADGIQGWTLRGATSRNVVVDSNKIVNLNPAEDNYLQGISIFDGKWDGLTVTNNLVITNTWSGITLFGVANALVINNTVIAARPDKYPTWLSIAPAKDKTPSQHVLVRNNLATQVLADSEDLAFDHNLAAKLISFRAADGALVKIVKGGAGDNNIVHPGLFKTFVDFDPNAEKFDLRPGPSSPALRAGADKGAPPTDIDGRPRTTPVDIGAYAR